MDHSEENIQEQMKNEEKYQSVLAFSPNAITVTDIAGKIIECNQSTLDLHGLEHKTDVIGANALQFISKKDRRRAACKLRKILQGGSIKNVRYTFLKQDGSEFIGELSAGAVKDRTGNIIGFVASVHDITERAKAEQIQQLLSNIANAVHEIEDLNDFYKYIQKQLSIIINTQNFYIVLYNKRTETIDLVYWVDDIDDYISTRPAKGTLSDYVIKNNKPLLLYDKDIMRMKKQGILGNAGSLPKVWMGVPLKLGKNIIGAIGVQNYEDKNIYKNKDLEILNIVSGQIATAINRKKMTDQLKTSLLEKEILLKEIHHRVKNNLQIIYSLINLQARHLSKERDKELLRQTQNRIKTMALIHEKLYKSKGIAKIDFCYYVKDLVATLFHSYGVYKDEIILVINIKNILLDLDKAIPCSLIINELVSNSIKHAFSSSLKKTAGKYQRNQKIIIDFRRDNGKYHLCVADNGKGFPENLDFQNTDSLGLQLVNTLAEQLHAEIQMTRKGGTKLQISFDHYSK